MHFFYKLLAPRPDFHLTMDESERETMESHKAYWAGLFNRGVVAVYGPVFDPKGVFGMAVVETDSAEESAELMKNDPAVSSGICTAELIPMHAGMIRSK